MTELELRAFDQELRQRDPRFLRVASANADEGVGEYELRTATGVTALATFTFCCEHRRVQSPNFDQAARARMAAAAVAAPDPYEQGLKKLRAASSTPERDFEDAYKQSRLADLDAEARRRALAAEEPEARMTTAELSAYAPPDAYEAGLKALRAKEQR
jgi:hypothetical protein